MKKLSEGRAFLVAFLASSVALLTTFSGALVFGNVWSDKRSREKELPIVDREIVTRGRQIFIKHCAECHGFDARGDEGSNLHSLRARNPLLRQVIRGGIKGEMPAYGSVLGDADVDALINYLLSLND